jgi:hypothetical protein
VFEKRCPIPFARLNREALPLDFIFEVSVVPSRVKYSLNIPFLVESVLLAWFIRDLDRRWGLRVLAW